MTRRAVVLNLPWPPRELSPNARVHWRVKANRVHLYRDIGFFYALAMMPPGKRKPLKPPVTADVTFVVPNKRSWDFDNAMAMLKPAWDGLVDAGLLVDDSAEMLRFGAPKMRYEKGQQYVEVRLT